MKVLKFEEAILRLTRADLNPLSRSSLDKLTVGGNRRCNFEATLSNDQYQEEEDDIKETIHLEADVR